MNLTITRLSTKENTHSKLVIENFILSTPCSPTTQNRPIYPPVLTNQSIIDNHFTQFVSPTKLKQCMLNFS